MGAQARVAPVGTLAAWLDEGPFALAMSSGFFGFFAHAGVLSMLEARGAFPHRVAGSSAGALVVGAHAAGLESRALEEELVSLERAHFWDPGPFYGLLQAGLLRGDLFRRRLERMLPVDSFEGCRVPLAVSTFDVTRRATHVIDRGALASAIVASCAVPGLFRPVRREGRWLLDGGIRDRPGLEGLPRGSRVLFHHLASRSPWRREREMVVPRRDGMITLVIEGLPRSGPDRLEAGREALRLARAAAERALSTPVVDGVVRVVA